MSLESRSTIMRATLARSNATLGAAARNRWLHLD
jgi:hypothetical protein